jgi:hypothetical protein
MGETRPADGADLVDVQRRVLALAVEDRLAHTGREGPMLLHLRRWDETGHAELLETGDLAIQGALGCAGLGGTLCGRMAEEDHRPDELVAPLSVCPDAEFQLMPLMGRLDPLAWYRHIRCRIRAPPSPDRSDAARGRLSGRAIIRACQGHEQYV